MTTETWESETCPKCKAEHSAGFPHTCRDTKCAFCRKELVYPSSWCITFGNASLLGKEAVDQVCPDCILDGFAELDAHRKLQGLAEWAREEEGEPHPFDCPGCPDCQGVKT